MKNPKFLKFKDAKGEFRFRLQAEQGESVLHSEGYKNSAGCDNGIASVRINSQIDHHYKRLTSTNNKPYFNLVARNGEVIGTSELYESNAGREKGIASVKRLAPTAPVDDQS